jgi:hypothetical protein
VREEAVPVVSGHKEMGRFVEGVSEIVDEEDVVERDPADYPSSDAELVRQRHATRAATAANRPATLGLRTHGRGSLNYC